MLQFHPPIKRSITIAGHQTSITLEPIFWDMLKAAARRRQLPMSALVAQIDLARIQGETPSGLASAVRLWLIAEQQAVQRTQLRWIDSYEADAKADYDALGQVMHDAVHALPSPYSEAERNAWMPEPRTGSKWQARLAKQQVIIAQRQEEGIIGFMSLERKSAAEGYIDFAYIVAEARGTGLFRRLYELIEARALGGGHSRVSTHASLAARPGFLHMGFSITCEEVVSIAGERLQRFAMQKILS